MEIKNSISVNSNLVFSSLSGINEIDPIDYVFKDMLNNSYLDTNAGPTVQLTLGSVNEGLQIESISTTYSFAPGVSCKSALSKLQNVLNINGVYENSNNTSNNSNLHTNISEDTKYEVTIKPIIGDSSNSNANILDLSPSKVNYSSVNGDVFDTSKAKPSKEEIFKWIDKYSSKYGMDSALVKAIVQTESSFNNQCISHSGAVGLMQLMPDTAREVGLIVNETIDERWDPEKNIEAGIKYISKYHKIISKHFGREDWNLTLAGYNAGPNRVMSEGCIPNITETKNYVTKVNKYWNQFK